jgi:methylated-DNA-protein-cysteine methyltransferase related protein
MAIFSTQVIEIIKCVPYGKVVSYGQVAALAGVPRAARQVGFALKRNESDGDIPWWRVINNEGRITIKGNFYNSAVLQKQMLEDEGIIVSKDFVVDMQEYRFRPNIDQMRSMQLDDEYIERLIVKYGL